MQGVVRMFDPQTGEGLVMCDTPDRAEFAFAPRALENSLFLTLRQGQRIVFEVDSVGLAVNVRTGAEVDMGLPSAQI